MRCRYTAVSNAPFNANPEAPFTKTRYAASRVAVATITFATDAFCVIVRPRISSVVGARDDREPRGRPLLSCCLLLMVLLLKVLLPLPVGEAMLAPGEGALETTVSYKEEKGILTSNATPLSTPDIWKREKSFSSESVSWQLAVSS